jgi:hypothetical protein
MLRTTTLQKVLLLSLLVLLSTSQEGNPLGCLPQSKWSAVQIHLPRLLERSPSIQRALGVNASPLRRTSPRRRGLSTSRFTFHASHFTLRLVLYSSPVTVNLPPSLRPNTSGK